jgi:hypothetical protein
MFSEELIELIKQVILSWQVIVITVVVILYGVLVSYVAKLRYRPKKAIAITSKPRAEKPKKSKKEFAEAETDEEADAGRKPARPQ